MQGEEDEGKVRVVLDENDGRIRITVEGYEGEPPFLSSTGVENLIGDLNEALGMTRAMEGAPV
jgi:hypothetical protein